MKVAILIPTLNKRDFVERTVGYYNSLNSPHPIYLGDASDLGYAEHTATMLKQFKNVEVSYFNWEGLDGQRTLIRLAENAQSENSYCVFQGDDDYYVPSSLTRCAEFLSENMDYRTAQGRAAIFTLDRSGAYGNILGLQHWWGVNSLEQETGLERLEYFRNKYYGMQYSVHRIEECLDDGREYCKIKESILGEIYNNYTFAIKGKSKFLDCFYMIRNIHNERCVSTTLLDWIRKPTWTSDIEKCIQGLSLSLQEVDNIPSNRAREIANEVVNDSLISSVSGLCQTKVNKNFLSSVKGLIPGELKKLLRQLSTLAMDENDMRLLRSKRSRFYKEFEPVVNSLSKRSFWGDK